MSLVLFLFLIILSTNLSFTFCEISDPSLLSIWNVNSAAGVQFPGCARSRMLTLGKSVNLDHSLNGGLLLE